MTEKTSKTRIGIVGLGSIANKVYLPVLTQRNDVEIVGIASRRHGQAIDVGERYRINNRFDAVADLLAQEPEVMFVHASTSAHYDIVRSCLEAGVHVYVDKPLTDSPATGRELANLASTKDRLLAVGFNRRFAPMNIHARSAVADPQVVQIAKHRTSLDEAPARSTVYDDLIHLVDTLLWVLGDAAELLDCHPVADKAGRLVTVTGTLVCGDVIGLFAMNRFAGIDVETLSLVGNANSAGVENLERLTLSRSNEQSSRSVEFSSWDSVQYRRGFVNLIDHVLECLPNPTSCSVNATRTLRAHELVEQIAARFDSVARDDALLTPATTTDH